MIEKLLSGLDQIEKLSLEELRRWENLVPLFQKIGLHGETFNLYGKDEIFVNPIGPGLWQIPDQLAKALVYLSDFKIEKMVEIGTYQGWTCAVITAYLRKFNSHLSTLTIDPHFHCSDFEAIQSRLPIYYVHASSQALRHNRFDLAFIDGDHSYAQVMIDYGEVGIHSPICLFHDINNKICSQADPQGSVTRAWRELKSGEPESIFTEILDHSLGYEYMGFGIRVKPQALRHP